MIKVAKAVATVAYVGYAPIAPGTVGSAVAAAVYWVLPELNPSIGMATVLFLLLVGIWASSRAEEVYGRDASKIVIDEFAGVIKEAIEMPEAERRRRMRKMRETIANNNIYSWGASIISRLLAIAEE